MGDRIEEELLKWRDVEVKTKALFSDETLRERHFLKEKLGFFQNVKSFYRKENLDLSEKMNLRILNGEIGKLKKYLFPNSFNRTIRDLVLVIGNVVERIKDSRQGVRHEGAYGHIIGKPLEVTAAKQEPVSKHKKEETFNQVDDSDLLEKNRINKGRGQNI